MSFIRYVFSIIILLLNIQAIAQDIQNIGVPYIENYKKSTYLAGNQNWSITKDEKGILYFGNSDGLLSFDGRSWQTHILPNHQIIRSVAADGKGRIYTGGYGEFGYWSYNDKAILKYHSLSSLVKDPAKLNNEIWKIYIDHDRVLFQSFGNILIYKDNKVEVVEARESLLFLLKAGKQFFIESIGKGLNQLNGNKLTLLEQGEGNDISGVLSVLPFRNNNFIIGTAKNGLFFFDGKSFKPWKTEGSDFLKKYQLNNGILIFGKYLAYGTILNGIIILDEKGNILQHINKSSGLQNNTVLSLFTDNYQNLWAGLDNGIDKIELNSALHFYFDKTGQLGTVYASIIFKDKIYLGTNQGLFYSTWNANQSKRQFFNFKFIPNSQGQVWDLTVYNNQLLCGHNNGTYIIDDIKINKISSVSGGWALKQMKLFPQYLIQGTYTGLVLYKQQKNGYSFSHKIDGFYEPSRYVEQDDKGNIWVSHPYKGIFKLVLSKDLKKVIALKKYDTKNGLPSLYNANVLNFDERIVFGTNKGFYIYDNLSDGFTPYHTLNNKLSTFSTSNKLIKADDHKYWIVNQGKVALANFFEPGNAKIDSGKFSILSGRMVKNYENISKINDHLFLISVDDGFVIFNKNTSNTLKNSIPKVIISRIENITSNTQLITESGSLNKDININYSQNSIRINYSLPYYKQEKIKFQYLLEGYSAKWSAWSEMSQKDFTNLPYGNYTFKVRAMVGDGAISPISQFVFTIKPPVYATPLAFLFYVFLACIIIYFIRLWYFRKLKKQAKNIKLKLQIERDEHLKQEAFINEQKLIKLKNEKLQAEVESKGREITNSAMSVVYKNELLQKINNEISNLKDQNGKKLAEDQLKRLQKIIEEGMNDKRDWNLFETSFNETHENFFKKLKSGHPTLVPNDLKLCAYLRMNMNSKEIASLLNITVRGVEIRRYRLRKKLDLAHDKNLNEFLIEL